MEGGGGLSTYPLLRKGASPYNVHIHLEDSDPLPIFAIYPEHAFLVVVTPSALGTSYQVHLPEGGGRGSSKRSRRLLPHESRGALFDPWGFGMKEKRGKGEAPLHAF